MSQPVAVPRRRPPMRWASCGAVPEPVWERGLPRVVDLLEELVGRGLASGELVAVDVGEGIQVVAASEGAALLAAGGRDATGEMRATLGVLILTPAEASELDTRAGGASPDPPARDEACCWGE